MNTPLEAQPDDMAVDRFADAMKEKLRIAREKGQHGWQHLTAEAITLALMDHLLKGDPVDVANFAMFLHQTQRGIDQDAVVTYALRVLHGLRVYGALTVKARGPWAGGLGQREE